MDPSNLDPYVVWAVIGLALVIAELTTGTFYLLVIGIAAFGSALAAYFGQDFPVQVIVGAAVAALGCYWVHAYRVRNAARQMAPVDAGHPASFENWLDPAARLARVRYRGASWDARVEGEGVLEAGAVLYVLATEGNTLRVTTRRPG
jgi:membrane protein implicated in regulation of membrane protease activity